MAYSKFGQRSVVMFALSCFGCDAVGNEDADPSQQGLGSLSGEDSGIGTLTPVPIADGGIGLTSRLPPKTDAGSEVQGDAGQTEPTKGDAGQGQPVIKPQVVDPGQDEGLPDCSAVYFRDLDGDGFGDIKARVTSCTKPAGYVELDGDCYDNNERAFPQATGQFLQDRGDGSFDYDCDGVETKVHTVVAACPTLLACTGLSCDLSGLEAAAAKAENGGWTTGQFGVPACGQEAAWGLSVSWYPGNAAATCGATGVTRTQTCR